MGRHCDNTETQSLDGAVSPVTAVPFSIAVWFRHLDHSTDAERTLWYMGEHANQNNHSTVRLERFANPKIEFEAAWAPVSGSSSGVISDMNWHQSVYTERVIADSLTANLYLDGAEVANGGATVVTAHSAWDRLSIGRRASAWNDSFADDIEFAEVCVINLRLSAAQVADLFRSKIGYLGQFGGVSPSNVLAYYPLWGMHDPEIDLSGLGRTLTVNGPAKCRHAPVRNFWEGQQAASELYVPQGGIVPAAMHNARMRRAS